MPTTDEARNKLAAQQQANGNGGTEVDKTRDPAEALIDQLGPVMESVLPQQIGIDRFARVALNTIRRTPKLLECDRLSLLGALATAAECGLEPGTHDGHCYILPFKNRGRMEATFVLGYKGLVELTLRSGQVSSVIARPVYQGEPFKFRETLAGTVLEHDPDLDGAPTDEQLRGCYAIARLTDGGDPIAVYLSREKIEGYRRRSKQPNGPAWTDDYVAMAMKTAAKRLEPWLPKSPELRSAVAADEQVARWSAGSIEIDRDEEERPIVVRTDREDAGWDEPAGEVGAGEPDEPAPAPEPEPDAGPENYRKLKKAQLVLRCNERGLDTEGTVDDLVARLEAADRGDADDGSDEIPPDDTPADEQPAHEPEDAEGNGNDDALEEGEGADLQLGDGGDPDADEAGEDVDAALAARQVAMRFRQHGIDDRHRRAYLQAVYGADDLAGIDVDNLQLIAAKLDDDAGADQVRTIAEEWLGDGGGADG